MVMYQKNSELNDLITLNQDRIKDLERAITPGENDSILRSRVSNTESRATQLERAVKQLAIDFGELESNLPEKVRQLASANAGGGPLGTEQMELVNHQINFLNDKINNLARSTLNLEQGNTCILSENTYCPDGFTRTATFGFIAFNPDNVVPSGYYYGDRHNADWAWLHGGLCCVKAQSLQQ